MEWAIKHQKQCNLDEDTCEYCYIIGESSWALKEAYYKMDQKKNQPKPKPQVKTKNVYDYRLQEWRSEVIK